jgi:hypothetical protein
MSHTTNIFNRASSGDADAVTAVWDDSELIAAWNAQLKRLQTEKSQQIVIESSAEDADSSSNDDSVDEESEMSGAEVALDLEDAVAAPPSNSGDANNRKRVRDEAAGGGGLEGAERFMPPIPPGLGRGMEAMLRAWFSAGYETGRYVGGHAAESQ